MTFWSAQTMSQFGVQIGQLAMPVLAVVVLGASEFQVGALNASAMAAFLVIGLPAGAWVDRWLKRRVMIAADLVRAAAMVSVPLLWWAGLLQMWHLYVVAGVLGIATVFFDVAYQSYVPVLVQSGQVPAANSRLESTAQVARMGGPAAGGGLLQVIAAPLLFLADTIGYLLSALLLAVTKDNEIPSPKEGRRPLAVEIKEGLGFVVRHPLISRIAACTGLMNFFTGLAYTLFPILVLRELDLGAGALGFIYSVAAAGGLLGAVTAPRLAKFTGEGALIPLASIVSAVFLLSMPLSVLMPDNTSALILLIVGEAGISFCVLVYNVMQVSMRQRVCPPRLLGRMNASIRFVVFGVMPLSGLLAGALGETIGLVPTLWIGVFGSVLAASPVVFSQLWALRQLPDSYEA
jgi:MFS family permease